MIVSQYFITNKIRKVAFGIKYKSYPAKPLLKKFKDDINVNCTFCTA